MSKLRNNCTKSGKHTGYVIELPKSNGNSKLKLWEHARIAVKIQLRRYIAHAHKKNLRIYHN